MHKGADQPRQATDSIFFALLCGLIITPSSSAHGGGGGGGGHSGGMGGGGGHMSSFHSSAMSFHASPSFHSSSFQLPSSHFPESSPHMRSYVPSLSEQGAYLAPSTHHGGFGSAISDIFGIHSRSTLRAMPSQNPASQRSTLDNENLNDQSVSREVKLQGLENNEASERSPVSQAALATFESAPKTHHFSFFGHHSQRTEQALPTTSTSAQNVGNNNAIESAHQAEAGTAAEAWSARHSEFGQLPAEGAATGVSSAAPAMSKQEANAQLAASSWAERHSGLIPGVAPAGTPLSPLGTKTRSRAH